MLRPCAEIWETYLEIDLTGMIMDIQIKEDKLYYLGEENIPDFD